MRAFVAQAANAAKAALLTLSIPALYGQYSVIDAQLDLRDVLSLIRIAVHASLGRPLPTLTLPSSVIVMLALPTLSWIALPADRLKVSPTLML